MLRKNMLGQVSWPAQLVQIGMLGLLILLFYLAGIPNYLFFGAGLYLLFSVSLKRSVPVYQRVGARYLKNRQYDLAILAFSKSYEFFQRRKWLDRYRAFFLFSSSRTSYSETALLSIAYCYGKQGDGKNAKETYEKIVKEFPNSEPAKRALELYRSRTGRPSSPPPRNGRGPAKKSAR